MRRRGRKGAIGRLVRVVGFGMVVREEGIGRDGEFFLFFLLILF